MTNNQIFGRNYLALAIGVAAAYGTALAVNHERDFLDSALTARGKVVSLRHGGHHPEIAFITNVGEHISARPSSIVALNTGDTVQIRYDPTIPRASAQIDTFLDRWMASLLIGAFSALCIAGGLTRRG